MMLSIPLWLSHLLRLAKELVIFSLVTISIVIVNNIVSIVAIINGRFGILIVVSINRRKLVYEIIQIALWEVNLQKVDPVVLIISKRLKDSYR